MFITSAIQIIWAPYTRANARLTRAHNGISSSYPPLLFHRRFFQEIFLKLCISTFFWFWIWSQILKIQYGGPNVASIG